jgi:small subunit ribosomal protein S8
MYYDLLPKIKNAVRAKKEVLYVPYSNMDYDVLQILMDAKYIKEVQKKTVGGRQFLEIKLEQNGEGHTLRDFKLISKPSRHLYRGYRTLVAVKQGYGLGVLSTPRGLMSHREAKKQKVGGEYLFEVW